MGSFYGNIKNSNKSQFTFDKVYPNRRQADLYAEHDSVFTGRYILVDYDYYDGVDGGWDNYDTIHGKDDNFVPTWMSEKNYQACTSPKEIYLVENAGHGAAYYENPELY